ncbi:hypothetical protein AYL99_07642 [Fonsecaea erecta]|uniref:Uncharacterized protein n=1 Tax=Fonsecaea erecta TaxID=1367422 RepID=A0A178ZFZ1_9EURO|nr:hypothetical protein AYL99_07642 [Fonsecaea erecta]OAP58552.1 hypothetical protein AYL99_07642 [Fonsecaea erecta]
MEELSPNMTLYDYEILHSGKYHDKYMAFMENICHISLLTRALGHKINSRMIGLLDSLERGTRDSEELGQDQTVQAVDLLALYVDYQNKAVAAHGKAVSIVTACAKLFIFMMSVGYTDENGVRLPPQGPEQSYCWADTFIDLVSKAQEAMWDGDDIEIAFNDIPVEVFRYH